MNMNGKRGFTIIETMLFIAVTGVIMAILLGGWSILINTQRYKDSLDTLYNYMQDQYNLVYNVENDRGMNLECTTGPTPDSLVVQPGSSSDSRGQSDCVLIGRYILIKDGGTDIRSYAIIGKDREDLSAIADYNPVVVKEDIGLSEDNISIPWGAQIVGRSGDNTPKNYSILLIRSPEDGTIHTYVRNDPVALNEPVINLGSGGDLEQARESGETMLCIDPGVVVNSSRQSVVIRPYASSKNSVETLGGSNGC